MFDKKCKRCGRKVKREYEFCPFCGFNMKREQEEKDFGLLGKADELGLSNMRMPFGFNTLFNSLLKEVDKQFRELDKEIAKEKIKEKRPDFANGISISISSENGKQPQIKVNAFGPNFKQFEQQTKIKEKPLPQITEDKTRKLINLPRKEAETKVRRLSNKIIYEINLPNVKSIENVIINKLENSIEIKAFAKDKVYFKLIPVKLPILDYKLEDEKLILELKPQ